MSNLIKKLETQFTCSCTKTQKHAHLHYICCVCRHAKIQGRIYVNVQLMLKSLNNYILKLLCYLIKGIKEVLRMSFGLWY